MAGKTFYVDGNGTARQIKKIYFTNSQGQTVQIKTDYYGTKNTFSSAHNVTYNIDINNSQVVEIDDGLDVIANAPTATKSGWTFRGWREDATATPTVVSSKACDRDGIVMYAVFQRTLTISYNGNGATSGSTEAQTGTQYYNNNNYANPTFTLRANGFAKANARSGNYEYKYTFANWRINSASGTAYNPGASFTASANTTFYAYWNAAVAVYYAVDTGYLPHDSGGRVSPRIDGYRGTNAYLYLSINGYGSIAADLCYGDANKDFNFQNVFAHVGNSATVSLTSPAYPVGGGAPAYVGTNITSGSGISERWQIIVYY